MSRYYDNEESGDMPAVFWEIDLNRALTSGRGQRILREFETSLRALPERKLLSDAIIRWDAEEQQGAVCAVGAYAAFNQVQAGKSWSDAFSTLAEKHSGESDEWETEWLGRSVGLARTVAWYLGWLNDEQFGHLKPRQRWRAMLRWVQGEIKAEAV